jgi:predicted GIY-YIG superfamily endonuclease
MSAQQLHLFDPARPLLQRFGSEFFRAIPPRPGVYIMGGDAERILYIGQSRNLRHRLGSYKNARPDRAPRKIIRLVHSVRTIVWEECDSAAAARLKENQLLRLHRPKFNVQNVYPQAYRFIAVEANPERLTFRLGTDPRAAGKSFGAFKGGCVRAHAALLRLLWAVANQPASPHAFPRPLLDDRPPSEFCLPLNQFPFRQDPGQWIEAVEAFLAGVSDHLSDRLTANLPPVNAISAFQASLQIADLETLAGFFEQGPKRNYKLRTQHEITHPLIAQDDLDDLLAINRERQLE